MELAAIQNYADALAKRLQKKSGCYVTGVQVLEAIKELEDSPVTLFLLDAIHVYSLPTPAELEINFVWEDSKYLLERFHAQISIEQSDFCFVISTGRENRFASPVIHVGGKALPNKLYEQIAHLDALEIAAFLNKYKGDIIPASLPQHWPFTFKVKDAIPLATLLSVLSMPNLSINPHTGKSLFECEVTAKQKALLSPGNLFTWAKAYNLAMGIYPTLATAEKVFGQSCKNIIDCIYDYSGTGYLNTTAALGCTAGTAALKKNEQRIEAY